MNDLLQFLFGAIASTIFALVCLLPIMVFCAPGDQTVMPTSEPKEGDKKR